MRRVVVVGSGASGVHFALSLLERGHAVTMVDVGYEGPVAPAPDASLNQLKESLPDPAAYFLGSSFEGVLLPDSGAEYYGIPPDKDYVLRHPPSFGYSASGFAPLFSFARGGLAQVWTGGCYPLNDAELADFPFDYADIEPYYSLVARRIGITGEEDDLSRFMPVHDHLLPPLDLDPHSNLLVETYRRKKNKLNRRLGCYLGRTRVATLSRDLGTRKACAYSGRCLWGCPIESLYTPSQTLRECMAHENFTYAPGLEARSFRVSGAGRVTGLVVRPAGGGAEEELPVECLALAAGALPSTEIFLRSAMRETGSDIRLGGLMDNRQVLVPFVNLKMIGRPYPAESYQYHLLGFGFESDDPRLYVHGQITTLKTAMMHPIIQKLPLDMATSAFVARTLHSALGIVNVNFPDNRRSDNYVTLSSDGETSDPRLTIRYRPSGDEPQRMREGLGRVRKALGSLGCVVPPGMAHVRPMGASVHYAGTLPMSRSAAPWTTTESCQSRDFENLFIVDGATFPFLPAKNLTFTLMANAARVAAVAF